MRLRDLTRSAAVLLAVAGLAVGAAADLSAQPTKGKAPRKAIPVRHPEVATTDECDACHADLTPEVVQQWRGSAHGMNLVKCFVCHGSAGADFARRPAPDRCLGCHGEQVATLTGPFMKGKTCFTCHQPHALGPHRVAVEGERK